jgi:hypothetical protein
VQNDSLFGHLASKSAQPENVATEALNYILNRSSIARSAFIQFAKQANVELPDELLFRTQAGGDDNAIPDLVGTDPEAGQVFVVEAKFWAGLTDNQPVAYLNRLPYQTASLLLFIAPARRFETLWPELLRRCRNENVSVEQSHEEMARGFKAIKVGTTHTLAITSWQAVLAYILRALETEGEHRVASDVQQLQGLCERMDSGAFLPLRSEELTSDTGARVRQYCDIVNEVTRKAIAEGIVSVEGLRATAGEGWFLRYVTLPDVANSLFSLRFDADSWAKWRATPLWLGFNAKKRHWHKEALASLELEQPPRLIVNGTDLFVPLHMSTGVEKREVVLAVFEQVKEVAQLYHFGLLMA